MKRKPHTPDEKAKLVKEALKGERTINEYYNHECMHQSLDYIILRKGSIIRVNKSFQGAVKH